MAELEVLPVSKRRLHILQLISLQSGLKEIVKEGESGVEVRIYYLECLAQATYIIKHEGVAFIVDPRRDVDAFLLVIDDKKSLFIYATLRIMQHIANEFMT